MIVRRLAVISQQSSDVERCEAVRVPLIVHCGPDLTPSDLIRGESVGIMNVIDRRVNVGAADVVDGESVGIPAVRNRREHLVTSDLIDSKPVAVLGAVNGRPPLSHVRTLPTSSNPHGVRVRYRRPFFAAVLVAGFLVIGYSPPAVKAPPVAHTVTATPTPPLGLICPAGYPLWDAARFSCLTGPNDTFGAPPLPVP